MNGIRLILKASDGKVIGVNRKGLERAIPQELAEALAGGEVELDGELIGSKFYAFDILSYGTLELRNDALFSRLDTLKKVVERIGSPTVVLVPTFTGESSKRGLLKHLRGGNKEGIVFKKLGGEYEAGRREALSKALAVKVKFYAEAAVVVIGWNKAKQSVEVGLRDNLNIVSVGNVTVPTKYVGQIAVGHTIRVRYLYATDGKQLYQPALDATDDGSIKADHLMADEIGTLKFEGKDE
jgi:ATP-dependent DNA ligase